MQLHDTIQNTSCPPYITDLMYMEPYIVAYYIGFHVLYHHKTTKSMRSSAALCSMTQLIIWFTRLAHLCTEKMQFPNPAFLTPSQVNHGQSQSLSTFRCRRKTLTHYLHQPILPTRALSPTHPNSLVLSIILFRLRRYTVYKSITYLSTYLLTYN